MRSLDGERLAGRSDDALFGINQDCLDRRSADINA
jgi:hypothetical protein